MKKAELRRNARGQDRVVAVTQDVAVDVTAAGFERSRFPCGLVGCVQKNRG